MKLEGLPVFDAKEPIAFTVTARDVARGGVRAPDSCAIALACKRERHSKDVRIHLNYSYVLEKDHWLRYRTPDSVSREIVAFDRGGSFDPGDYHLLVPYKSDRLNKPKPRHLISLSVLTKKGPQKRYMHITANVRTRPALSTRVIP